MSGNRITDLLACVAGRTADAHITRARTRFSVTGQSGVPGPAEQHVLERTLGSAVKAVRADAGMSQWTLSCRSGCARVTVERLEAGLHRPTASLLATLAIGVRRTVPPKPGDQEAEAATLRRLLMAAGPSLVADTPGGLRRRERRLHDAHRPWQRQCRQRHEAERSATTSTLADFRAALAELTPQTADNLEVLDRVHRVLTRLRGAP